MSLFGRKKYTLVSVKRKEIPKGLWTKCPDCDNLNYSKELESNLQICPKCNWHFTFGAYQRIESLADEGTFQEMDREMASVDPLDFKGPKTYKQKLQADQAATGLIEAVISGTCKIGKKNAVLAVTDSRFIMGSMGSVVGEKVTRAIEHATAKKFPVIIVSGSGGGARMYEGAISLMQMAKTCAALARHSEAGFLHVSVLTNPTMGGIMASFAGVGDVIIAEPKALVGFAGPRVIEQTIRQKLPKGFQSSEFLLAHGLIDMIVDRKSLKDTIAKLIDYFHVKNKPSDPAGEKD
ncbi:MAG: acetyl-CoA carboxylase carboxyltransferase subunit beta [Candidatus Omnitrophica bacterium]|nr:acetyl-CoA carboxylase carboxyltransferase subunit beta [Candidatus Omnitrophota bacterium]